MTETKNILLIGRTGRGKSTLVNVITNNENKFKESSGGSSETKKIQFKQFINDKDNNSNYLIVDTPGFGDTQLPTEKILDEIAEAVYLVRGGVSQVFFVTNGRFEQYEMATYDLLRAVIFDQNVTNNTTIIRTNFENFRKPTKCKENVEEMIEGGGRLSEIIESCQKRVVHVNNPQITIAVVDNESDEEAKEEMKSNRRARDKSREKLLKYLKENCLEEIYHPPKLKRLGAEIGGYMEEKKRLEKVLEEEVSKPLKTIKKKRIRRLKINKLETDKIDDVSPETEESKKGTKDTKKNKIVKFLQKMLEKVNRFLKRSEKKKNEHDFQTEQTEDENIEKSKIKELEQKREKLRSEIQEKVKNIREIIRHHILHNCDDIKQIKGGHIFLDSIKDSKETSKINEKLVSDWLIKNLDYQQAWDFTEILENSFNLENCFPFCLWLMNNNREMKKEMLNNNIIREWIDEYSNQLEEGSNRLEALKNQQSWESLKNILEQNFKNWTSGNPEIDKFIQDYQLKANDPKDVLEWIHYNNFSDVRHLAEGGFGKVYKAEWKDGPIKSWNVETSEWERESNKTVALKSLDNSGKANDEFLQEVSYHKLFSDDSNVVNCYGISQDLETKNYSMVIDYIPDGNLREFLKREFNSLDFEDKLYQLYTIALGLDSIHEQGLIHKDFHPGNILVDDIECYITDLGLSKSINENENGEIYGVLPYVAPEVLKGEKYTQASDIYSFGIAVYELFSGLPPYHNMSYDEFLALKICQGLRPKFQIKIPQLLKDLIERCWDMDLKKRPTATDLVRISHEWQEEIQNKKDTELYRQYEEAEEYNKTLQEETRFPKYEMHKGAVYHSKLLPTREITQLLQTPEFSQSLQINFEIPEETKEIEILETHIEQPHK